MKNIELKVKINDFDFLNKLIDNKSLFLGTLFQKDTYYLLGDKRLKTREEGNKLEVIFYKRENKQTSKDSKYLYYSLNKYFFFVTRLFLNFIFGKKKIVEKKRDLYLDANTRIHVDKVKNLGDFLELETVVRDEKRYPEYLKEHNEIIAKLDLNKYKKLHGSYSDLI